MAHLSFSCCCWNVENSTTSIRTTCGEALMQTEKILLFLTSCQYILINDDDAADEDANKTTSSLPTTDQMTFVTSMQPEVKLRYFVKFVIIFIPFIAIIILYFDCAPWIVGVRAIKSTASSNTNGTFEKRKKTHRKLKVIKFYCLCFFHCSFLFIYLVE